MSNFQKIRVLHRLAEPLSHNEATDQNRGPKRSHIGGRRTKVIASLGLIIVILVALFAFLPRDNQTPDRDIPVDGASPQPTSTNNALTDVFENINNIIYDIKEPVSEIIPRKPGVLESATAIDSAVWQTVATIAWRYYQPGIGVDRNSGLPWSGAGSPYITDWDVGVYIQAVIDAENLGLINRTGAWGFDERINKILNWLETRELNNGGYPYWFYRSDTGENWRENSDKVPDDHADIADIGRLFVTLNNLRVDYPEYGPRVNNIAIHGQNYNRTNYTNIIPTLRDQAETDTNIYAYYIISGFAAFWPELLKDTPGKIIDNIFKAEYISVSGVMLPKTRISCEPMLCALFEIKNNDPRLKTLIDMTYEAHEAYYNISGKYRAFGEGPTDGSGDWQWEWVVLPDGRTWIALNSDQEPTDAAPMIYTKIAYSFLAIYNTNYTRNMCIYLERNLQDPDNGFEHGIDENEKPLNGIGALTNGLILSAARYYIEKNT